MTTQPSAGTELPRLGCLLPRPGAPLLVLLCSAPLRAVPAECPVAFPSEPSRERRGTMGGQGRGSAQVPSVCCPGELRSQRPPT